MAEQHSADAASELAAVSSSATAAAMATPAPGPYPACAVCGTFAHDTSRCRAKLHPDVIVHLIAAKKQRFTNYLLALAEQAAAADTAEETDGAGIAAAAAVSVPAASEAALPAAHDARACLGLRVIETLKEPELLFLRSPRPLELVRFVQRSPLLQRHFQSIYVAQFPAKDVQELVQRVQARCAEIEAEASSAAGADPSTAAAPCVLRVQTHPKALRNTLLGPLEAAGVDMHPHEFTHVLHAARAFSRFYGGVVGRDLYFLPHSRASLVEDELTGEEGASASDVLSRAYWKLHEAFLLDGALRARARPGGKAIDIGASPGGWTAFLASKGLRVLAVDPGVVLATSPLVQHVPKRVENALSEGDVARFVASGNAAGQGAGEGISLVVCDMNIRPLVSAQIIRQLCEAVPCPLSPDAMLVLTCKETLAGRSKLLVAEAAAELADWWTEPKVDHLLSNGKERSLVAHIKFDDTPEERLKTRQRVQLEAQRQQEEREQARAVKDAARAAAAATKQPDGSADKQPEAHSS